MPIEYIKPDHKLAEAAKDYKYLLDRGFSREHSLRFVDDHYILPKEQRLILYRSIHPTSHIDLVYSKTIRDYPLANVLYVDFYNVIITIASIIRGQTLYIGNDGFIRDMSGVHGRIRDEEIMSMAITDFKEIIDILSPPKIVVYLESQVSKSGQYMAVIGGILNHMGEAILTKNVDSTLYNVDGTVATSDSVIHQHAREVIDIPQILASKSNYRVKTVDFRYLR